MEHYIENVGTDSATSIDILKERTIGSILVEHGKLKHEDIDRVFRFHKEQNLRFGEAAQKLRLVSKTDIQQALATQFNYPCIQPGEALLAAELVSAYQPLTPQGEAIRDLRSQLLFRWFNKGNKVLAVMSTHPGEGRTYTTANLAVALAQWGGKTLLIDANFRNPRIHQLFNLPNKTGLSSILSKRAWTETIQQTPYFPNLNILPAGALPPNPSELLGRQEFVRLLQDASSRYDFILIDTPASKHGSDALTIAARAGGAIVLTRQDHSRLPEVQALMEGLHDYGTTIVGSVLNQF